MSQSLEAYLVLSALLFGIGAFGFLAKRNAIAMLMSIELMLNSVNLAIIAFGAFTPEFAAHASSIALFVIAVAAVMDGIDGRIARALGVTSRFGAELDSLSDFVCFGVSPAVVIYLWSLNGAGGMGWSIALIFAVCCAVRLARFKVKDPLRGQGGYAGLPITANAAWVALFVFISLTPPRDQFSLREGPVAALFLLGIIVFTYNKYLGINQIFKNLGGRTD